MIRKTSTIFLAALLVFSLFTGCAIAELLPGFEPLPDLSSAPPIINSIPPPGAQAVETWQEAYAEFLRGVDTYYIRDYIVPGSYDIPPLFCLYDIDKNGIPELILISDNGNWEDVSCDVFTYGNTAAQHTGSIKFELFGEIGAPDNTTEGLYSDNSYKGHYGKLYFYTIEDGVFIERLICEYNFRPPIDENGYIYIYDDNGMISNVIEGEVGYVEASFETLGLPCGPMFDFYRITEENIEKVIY